MAIGAIAGAAATAAGANFANNSILSPVSSGISNLISGGTWQQSGGQVAQNQFNAQEAEKQRAWEKMMSDTSYQRAVDDMKKAGINPAMLYASGGNGASTPSGASASGSGPNSGRAMDLLGNVGQIMNSVNNARKLDYEFRKDELPTSTTRKIYDALGNLTNIVTSRTTRT